MSDTQDARDELSARLETVSLQGAGLRVVPFVSESISPPVAMLAEGDPFTDYLIAYDRGTQVYDFVVTVIVSKIDARNAIKLLDAVRDMNGAGSVRAALDVSSGTVVDFVTVASASSAKTFTFGTIDYIGCTFPVAVSLSNTAFR